MAIVHLVNGKRFEAAKGQSLLDAAQAAGLVLEHGCRTGRCGSCRAPVQSGETAALIAEEALSDMERAAGIVLTCAREARGDVRLGIEDLGALAGIPRKTVPCRIAALEPLLEDVLRVQLRLPPNAGFDFLAGQYVDVIHQGERRSYSLATTPGQFRATGLLELQVRRHAGGRFSRYWFDEARPNDLLRLEGPLGSFYLRDVAGLDVVLLATGTGIAPIQALIAEVAARPQAARPRSLRLLWGGRVAADLYWMPPATDALIYTPVLSRADASWSGARGHVQDVLLAQSAGRDWSRSAVYACGSNAMVQAARAQLIAAGLNPARFHADAFVPSHATPAPQASSCACA